MLFWGLAGFVDPDDHVDKKEGLGADALAQFAGVDEHDEFFKDNAIEVVTVKYWQKLLPKYKILTETFAERGNHNVLASHGILLLGQQPDIDLVNIDLVNIALVNNLT